MASFDLIGSNAVMKRLALTGLAWLLAGTAVAAEEQAPDRWYDVEVILFTVKDDAAVEDERWPDDPGTPDLEQAITLAPEAPAALTGASPVVPYRLLPEDQRRLDGVENRLAHSGRFVPFLHLAWRQPAFPRATPGAEVRLQWEEASASGESGEAGAEGAENLAAPPGSGLFGGEPFHASPLPPQPARLDGTLRVSVNRYLHLSVDLLYDEGGEQEAGGKGIFSIFSTAEREPHRFRMTQSRRLHSGELHYFDHPRFGMIALLTPFEYPVVETEEEGKEAPSEAGDQGPQ